MPCFTIVETPSDMVTAFFAGTREKYPDVGIWVSRLENGIWRMRQPKAVRREEWKLVINSPDNAPKLYNLNIDISEKKNIVKQNSKKVDQLYSELTNWEKEIELA